MDQRRDGDQGGILSMLRSKDWGTYWIQAVGLLVLAFASVELNSSTRASETQWQSHSTLSRTIAPQNLALDIEMAATSLQTDSRQAPSEWVRENLKFRPGVSRATKTPERPQLPRFDADAKRPTEAQDGPSENASEKIASAVSTLKWQRPQSAVASQSDPTGSIANLDRAGAKGLTLKSPLELPPSVLGVAPTHGPATSPEAQGRLAEGDVEALADKKASPALLSPPVRVDSRPALSRRELALRDTVRRVLRFYYERPLNTGNRSPWEVMHALLAYEVHSRVLQDSPRGDPITAAGWLCFNRPCKGRTLLYVNNDDELRVRVGPALQGHQGQLLAMLAQSRIKSDYPVRVDDKQLTINDLIDMEKRTCYPRTELTFKLIGLSHYLDLDATWINDQGMTWDFPSLIDEELRQPVRTAACGGTHRLSGLTLAVKKWKAAGRPLEGEYAKAAQFVANYQNYAYRLQNRDGSLSTEWFRGPGDESDIDRRLKTTGHTLEWLLYAASEKQLTYQRTLRAAEYLSNLMWSERNHEWEAGPLGHAVHALVLYDRLVFAPHDGSDSANIAQRQNDQRR